jgi:hypothetical protein
MTGGFTSGKAGCFLQNQALERRNLRNEQGERNAASELCTAKQVEMFHYLLTLAGEVLSSPSDFRFHLSRSRGSAKHLII